MQYTIPSQHRPPAFQGDPEGAAQALRRKAGVVYTPANLVDFVLDLGDYVPERPIELQRVLDPACGAGAFLEALVGRLSRRLAAQGRDPLSPAGRLAFLGAVDSLIFGVDKDPHACERAISAVRRLVAQLSGKEVPASFFGANVVVDDFLTGPLDRLAQSRFDLIVGNPPYVAANRLDASQKDEFRARFRVAIGRIDLYALFFERALQLLAPHGRLAFITPNKFLTSESSGRLRKWILSTASIRKVASFRSHRVFEDAATVPCVTLLERSRAAAPFSFMECAVPRGNRGPVVVQTRQTLPHPVEGETPWFLANPGLLALARSIEAKHPRLGETTSRISAGIATGRDRIFVLETRTALELELEPELRRAAVRGRDVLRNRVVQPDLEVIIPYLPQGSGKPALVRLEDFPRTFAYLESRRAELETRHCVRTWKKPWYDLHDPWTLDVAVLTKILVPDVARFNRFALDEGRCCPLHSAYYIVPDKIDGAFLTAVLNSAPVEFLVRLMAPVVKDGFSRYRRQFLIGLPVPRATDRDRARIVRAVEDGDLEAADEFCTRLFGLSRAQLELVREFLDEVSSVHGASVEDVSERLSA